MMATDDLQELCELGQEQLMRMEYARAERTLAGAEEVAWQARDFDTLSRVYMPLLESRRQKRQRSGEGEVLLDIAAKGPGDEIDGRQVVEEHPFGQLLVAGWGTIEPARVVRRLARERGLYLETFLGAVYLTDTGRVVVLAPLEVCELPGTEERRLEELKGVLPMGCLVLSEHETDVKAGRGTAGTFSRVMGLWERLHGPFLAAAEGLGDRVRRIEAHRETMRVDEGCELAHQRAAEVARELSRG